MLKGGYSGLLVTFQFSSVNQSCPILCNPMDWSTPVFPFHHQFPEPTQTHVHRVGGAIQPSHPLSSPSLPAFNFGTASGSFSMSQFFTSGGQSADVSASASVLPINNQDWFPLGLTGLTSLQSTAAAAKSLQSCPTLCDPINGSPTGSPIPGILQARTLEWVAISFSNAWKWKVKVKLLSRVQPSATPWTAAFQAPPSMGFSRQEYWSGVLLPFPRL